MGEAEWLPNSSERDTEIPEVERAKRERDGKAREMSEILEVSLRRRSLWPEIGECYRKLLGWAQSEVPLLSHAFALRTPRPIGHASWATPKELLVGWAWREGSGRPELPVGLLVGVSASAVPCCAR